MTPELWQRLKPLFHAALAEGTQNRAAFIESACGGDRELKEHLEQLLNAAQLNTGSLDAPLAHLKDLFGDNGSPFQPGDPGAQDIIRLTMALLPGTKLDGYEVLGLLGAGGMGEVYRARDYVLKREVAIKVLPSFVSQDPDRLRRFELEAQAAAALIHPNIVAIHRFGVFEGAPYLVSELLVGDTFCDSKWSAALCQSAKRSITVFKSLVDWRPRTTKASFIGTSNPRTYSLRKTAVSKYWTSVSRN